MRLALTQLMQSLHYGRQTLFRRLFSPVIDKLLFAATKADHDHRSARQYGFIAATTDSDARQNAAFEGSVWIAGLASVQATTSGIIDVNGENPGAAR